MRNIKGAAFYILLLLCSLVLAGCSQKADESKPIGEVKAEAEKMDTAQLKAAAMKYKEAIMAKKDDMENVASKLEDIPVTEMLGDKAKEINAQIENIGKSVSALQERFEVYYNKLKEKGGDTSGLDI